MNLKLKRKLNRVFQVVAMSLGLLIGGAGLAWAATVIGTSITLDNGAGLQTSTSDGNTAVLRAYDVDGTAYTTFATLTAGNTPTMDLNTNVTIGGVSIYRVDGTDVAVADGGTGASTAADARTNLGLVIGTNVQAWTDNLDSWSAIAPASMATLAGVEALTNKTVNGVNFVTEADGFTVAGGTISRTFTVSGGRLFLQLDGSEPMTTLMIPSSGQLVTRDSSDSLTNKSLNGLGLATEVGGFSITNNTIARSFSVAGGQDLTLTATGATTVTLPTTGTLATLAGAEALTNKTVNGFNFIPNFDGFTIDAGSIARSLTVSGQNVALIASGATTVTLPTTGTLATLTGVEELTNKTVNGVVLSEEGYEFAITGGSITPVTLTVAGGDLLLSMLPGNSILEIPAGTGEVVTDVSTVALSNKTYNGLSLTSNTNGFTVTGGSSTSSSLIIDGTAAPGNITLAKSGTNPSTVIVPPGIIELDQINGDELDSITGNNYGIPIIWKVTLTDGSDEVDLVAPFKFRFIDAWSIRTSGDAGEWSILNSSGSLIIAGEAKLPDPEEFVRAVSVVSSRLTVNNGATFTVANDISGGDFEVYMMIMRVD